MVDLPLHSVLDDLLGVSVPAAVSKPTPPASPPAPYTICDAPPMPPSPIDTLQSHPASTASASDSSSAALDFDHGSDTEYASGSNLDPSIPDVEVVVPSPFAASALASVAPIGHPMIAQVKSGIFKPRHWANLSHTSDGGLYSALFASADPTTHTETLKGSKWVDVMHSEMHALSRNHTWSLVSCLANMNVVGSC